MPGYYCQNHPDAVLERGIEQAAKGALNAVLDILYPIRCLGCFRVGRFICHECVSAAAHSRRSDVSGSAPVPALTGHARWCRDKKPANRPHRRAIPVRPHQPDSQCHHHAEIPGCPRHRAGACQSFSPPTIGEGARSYDAIVPVVSHPSRVRKRGYSQAALIASQLGPPARYARA